MPAQDLVLYLTLSPEFGGTRFGPFEGIEARLGSARFLLLYLVSGLAGSAGALIATPNNVTVGASGAIFGILGAGLVLERQRDYVFGGSALQMIVINLVITFSYLLVDSRQPERHLAYGATLTNCDHNPTSRQSTPPSAPTVSGSPFSPTSTGGGSRATCGCTAAS